MESFFGLTGRPFAAAPRTDRYFPARAIESARTTLIRAIERAEGPALVVGPVGAGKSLLCRLLAEHFKGTLRVAVVAAGRIESRRALWQSLLYELNLPFRGMDDGELRLALVGHLTSQAAEKPTLIVVDEAHLLSLRLLEEIRTLTDLLANGQPAVRLVLAGGSALEEHFAHPKLEAFSQRLCARCYLEPLTRAETGLYIAGQVESCGSIADSLFVDDAIEAVHRATDGVPRLINQVCDHALVLAFADGALQVTGRVVEEAWADLQQLPLPWSVEAVAAPVRSGTIEFGRLDDDESADGDIAVDRVGKVAELGAAVLGSHRTAEPAVNQTVVIRGETLAHVPDPASFAASTPDNLAIVTAATDQLVYDDVPFPADWPMQGEPAGAGASNEPPSAGKSRPREIDAGEIAPVENPFGEEFDDEEQVIDRSATLIIRRPAPSASERVPPPPAPRDAVPKGLDEAPQPAVKKKTEKAPATRETPDHVEAPWPSGEVLSFDPATAAWPAAAAYNLENAAPVRSTENREPALAVAAIAESAVADVIVEELPSATSEPYVSTPAAAVYASVPAAVASPPRQPTAELVTPASGEKIQTGKPRGDMGQLFSRLKRKASR